MKRIIDITGSDISVSSETGVGSTFTVTLGEIQNEQAKKLFRENEYNYWLCRDTFHNRNCCLYDYPWKQHPKKIAPQIITLANEFLDKG